MSYLRKRVLIIFSITWAVSALVLILFYFLVLSPKQKELKAIEQDVKAVSSPEFIENSKKEAVLKKDKYSEYVGQINQFMVDVDSWIEILPYVSDVAKKTKLSMFSGKDNSSSMSYDNDKEFKKINLRQLTVSFNSGFSQFAKFVNALEKGKPVVLIREFEIQRAYEDKGSNEIRMNLQVLVSKEHNNFNKSVALKK